MPQERSSIAELAPNRVGEAVGTYAIAYLDAAGVLFSHGAKGLGMQDLCFYPAALNLRHGMELIAKQLSDFTAYELRDPTLLDETGHSLAKAWARGPALVQTLLDVDDYSAEPGDVRKALDTLASLIAKLDAIDPTGTLFRYPEDVRWLPKKKQTGNVAVDRERVDQPVKDDRVDLREWATHADQALAAAQTLDYYFNERTSFLRHHRGDPPAALADLTTGKISETDKADYRKSIGWTAGDPARAVAAGPMVDLLNALRADGPVTIVTHDE